MTLLDLLVVGVVLLIAAFWHTFAWPVALVCVIVLILERYFLKNERV